MPEYHWINNQSVADYERACIKGIEPRGNPTPPPKPIYEMSENELLLWARDVDSRYTPDMHVDGRPMTMCEAAALLILSHFRRHHDNADELLDLAESSEHDTRLLAAARRIARFIGGMK